MKRAKGAFEIALAALACAVATAALTLGAYVNFMFVTGYLIAIFALMVPLSKKLFWGDMLAFVGAAILSSLFGMGAFGFLKILPFVCFFGLHPLINALQRTHVRKKVLHALIFLIKAAWFDLTLLVCFFVLVPLFGLDGMRWYPYFERYLYLIVFAGGTVFFALYDYLIFLCQRSVDLIVKRIGR